LNAFADGKNVFIARGMMRFAQDDTELALVVSHEMAHNSMLHMKAKTSNYVLGTVLDILITATTGVNTQGTFGNMAASRYSQEFEAEADYVGLYMMAAAGKNIDSAPKFWRRMAAAHPTGIEADYSSSHPSTAYRLLALEETVKEIKLKKETGASLTPEMKQQTPATAATTPPATSPGATSPLQTLAASEAIEGHFSGKASKVAGLAGLLKGIDIKLSFTNKTEKAIARLEGQARLYADDGEEIGLIPFRSENGMAGNNNIELTQTVYPLIFSGYHKLRELDDSKIRAEFIFETIEFVDGSKATK
jgi:Peptidase family M48